jgi:hypothetical protein
MFLPNNVRAFKIGGGRNEVYYELFSFSLHNIQPSRAKKDPVINQCNIM